MIFFLWQKVTVLLGKVTVLSGSQLLLKNAVLAKSYSKVIDSSKLLVECIDSSYINYNGRSA
jgi:hypothetical protein